MENSLTSTQNHHYASKNHLGNFPECVLEERGTASAMSVEKRNENKEKEKVKSRTELRP